MPRTVGSNRVLIGVDNWFERFPVSSVGSADEGYPFVNALNGKTFDFWKAGAAGSGFQATVDPVGTPEYLAFAAHTLGSTSGELELAYTDDMNMDHRVKLFDGDSDETRGWLTGETPLLPAVVPAPAATWTVRHAAASFDALVGVLAMGRLLEVPSMIYEGHRPLRWAKNDDVRPRLSATGHYLGSTVYRYGKRTQLTIRYIPAEWFRENEEAVLSLSSKPFFLWWRPDGYPEEVEYCWCRRDPEVNNTGPRGLMSLRLDIEAYDG